MDATLAYDSAVHTAPFCINIGARDGFPEEVMAALCTLVVYVDDQVRAGHHVRVLLDEGMHCLILEVDGVRLRQEEAA